MNGAYKMSEKDIEILNESFNNIKTLANNYYKLMSQIVKEKIKPIIDRMIDRIRELLKDKQIIRIKYRPIKILIANSYIGVNKPKRINCRSNC